MSLGENIKKRRMECGLTQQQLADAICERHSECFSILSREAVSRWETGSAEPDSKTLVALSDILNISLDELIKDDDIEKENDTKQDDFQVPPGAMSGVQAFADALGNLDEKKGGDPDE